MLRYIRRYWFFVALSILCAAVTVALTLYVPILTGDAIDYIIDKGLVNFDPVLSIVKKIVVVVLLTAVSQWMMNVSNNRIAYHVIHDIRREAFHKIEILPLKYIDGHSYGEVVSRVIADVDQFSDGLLMGFTQLFTGVITILGTLLFMISLNGKITLVVVLVTPVSLFVAAFIAKKTYSMFKLQSETRGELRHPLRQERLGLGTQTFDILVRKRGARRPRGEFAARGFDPLGFGRQERDRLFQRDVRRKR